MARLFLVRHGKTDGELELYFGHTDIPLHEEGIIQARRLAKRLSSQRFSAAYSSDLKRALKTAEIVSSLQGLSVFPRPELRELNFGLLEGKSFDEIRRLYPVESKAWFFRPDFSTPGGESLNSLKKRLKPFMYHIYRAAPDDNILIVSHKGTIRVIICLLIGLSLKDYWKISIEPASLSILETHPEGAVLHLLNDTSHLIED